MAALHPLAETGLAMYDFQIANGGGYRVFAMQKQRVSVSGRMRSAFGDCLSDFYEKVLPPSRSFATGEIGKVLNDNE